MDLDSRSLTQEITRLIRTYWGQHEARLDILEETIEVSADANDGIIESFVYLEKIPSLSTFIFMKLYVY